ncbi:MAG: DUF4832 domain-containing protein [Pirellulales bacterium]
MNRAIIVGLFSLLLVPLRLFAQDEKSGKLEYAQSPIDNPLKGLVPYQADVRKKFPHSLEFNYLPYSSIVKGYDQFDWSELEQMLEDISSRGHQVVVRIFLEYPAKTEVIPKFLIDDGLKVHRYTNTNTAPLPPSPVETPDYEDVNLRRSLKNFIAAFGNKYDGDPRLGFITAGLLGTWGEWHTYPKDELFASKKVQTEVMDAYEAAFKVTPVLLRYPAGDSDHFKAANAHRKFGYHDDSFAWATLDTGKADDSWFYMAALKAAGPSALEKWKFQPIGGEIRPEAWGKVFDNSVKSKQIQNFRQCVDATHVTWLMDSGMFEKKQSQARIENASAEVQRMGYEFYASKFMIQKNNAQQLEINLHVENRGVAPFYYDWKVEWGFLSGNTPVKTVPSNVRLREQLPDANPKVWKDSLDMKGLAKGKYILAVRAVNPLKNGKHLRFANASQDRDADGWLSIAAIEED